MIEKAAADIPLTRPARDVLERASAEATRREEGEPTPADVLRAVLDNGGHLTDETLSAMNVDRPAVLAYLPPNGPAPALPLRQLLVNANREAQVLGHHQVDSIHLLLALLYSDSRATSAALQQAGLTLYDLRRRLQTGAPPDAPLAARPGRPSTLDRSLRRRPLPSLRGVVGISPVFLGLLAALVVSGAILWYDVLPQLGPFVVLVFVIAGWVASVCVHEFSHALVAYLGGDRSVAASGYLTLDPLRYTNVVLSVVVPVVFLLLGGIALPGGAVYIDRGALRSKTWDSAVSAAGPAGTLLCGVVAALPFVVPGHLLWITQTNLLFFEALSVLAYVQVFAFILNLVPVPGLDGFGIIRPWLPYSVQSSANQFGFFGIFIVFALLWYVAPVRTAFFVLISTVTNALGIPGDLIGAGLLHMRLQ